MRLHKQKWQQYLKHALTVVHVMSVAIEFHDAHGITVEPLSVFQNRCPCDITRHFRLKFPLFPYTCFLAPELLNVFFNFFTEEDFLETDKCPILERQLAV